MSLPKEPRQKMINLMYLVLTALLALNVSSEIINAFKTIDNSLVSANGVITQKNESVYKTFESKLKDGDTREQAAIWQKPALEAQKLSAEVYSYLETLKGELKKESGLTVENGVEKFKEDDLDAATRLFVSGTRGDELLNKLTTYKQQLINVLDPNKFQGQSAELIKKLTTAIESFKTSLPLDLTPPKSTSSHGEASTNKPWQSGYFRMTPTVAAITMLSKLQNDVKNSESQITDFCLKQVGSVEIVYDNFQAIASQSSEYLMPGQELVIKAGIGAFSKQAAPTVTIGGNFVPLNAEGVAEQKIVVGGTGSYTTMVNITFKKPDGTVATVPKEVKYTVGSPTGITVSAEKVKVFYVGLDNEISVSGGQGGAESKKVSVSGAGGSIQEIGGGRYNVRVSQTGEATVNVTNTSDGKTSSFKFRVKKVPNPIAMVGASEGGPIGANAIKAQQGVRAELRDFVFEGVEFNIVSYTLVANGGSLSNMRYNVNNGALFNRDSKAILEQCGPGTTVFIDEIIAVGPDGGRRKLPGIVFQLQ